MDLGLTDRVVVVTGAGRGIGAAIARGFVEEGATVVGWDLTVGTDSAGVVPMQCDVTDSASVDAATAEVIDRFGHLDVLVNNAGVNATGLVDEMDPDAWRRTFDVNVTGVFTATRAVIPQMKRQKWGRIVNAASFAAVIPSVGAAAYGASKAAVVQFTRVLASELGPWGITANSYAPGMIPTAMNGFADLSEPDAAVKLDQLSIRRWGEPADVADLVCFLASTRAGYITGALIDVSGGKFATQSPADAYR